MMRGSSSSDCRSRYASKKRSSSNTYALKKKNLQADDDNEVVATAVPVTADDNVRNLAFTSIKKKDTHTKREKK